VNVQFRIIEVLNSKLAAWQSAMLVVMLNCSWLFDKTDGSRDSSSKMTSIFLFSSLTLFSGLMTLVL